MIRHITTSVSLQYTASCLLSILFCAFVCSLFIVCIDAQHGNVAPRLVNMVLIKHLCANDSVLAISSDGSD